jgi:hypothetical protein
MAKPKSTTDDQLDNGKVWDLHAKLIDVSNGYKNGEIALAIGMLLGTMCEGATDPCFTTSLGMVAQAASGWRKELASPGTAATH